MMHFESCQRVWHNRSTKPRSVDIERRWGPKQKFSYSRERRTSTWMSTNMFRVVETRRRCPKVGDQWVALLDVDTICQVRNQTLLEMPMQDRQRHLRMDQQHLVGCGEGRQAVRNRTDPLIMFAQYSVVLC